MNGNAVELRGLRKAFGARVVFDDLSLDIRRGETITIIGASGSGKSVLLKTILGLVAPDGGAVRVEGRDLVGLDETARLTACRRISMLFQANALFDSLTVAENVAYPLRHQPGFPPADVAARVAESLALVGLPDVEEMMPSELSGGMKKRVALARAIAPRPQVVLYDEPTNGLDPVNTRRIDELIRSVQRRFEVTQVVVTHDLPSAFLVSDRVAMLEAGRIRTVDAVEPFRRTRDPVVRAFVDAMGAP